MKKKPEGRGSQRAASVCRQPGAQHHVYAAERSVRVFQRSRSRPHRPRNGSLSAAKSAGTGQRKSTICRRDGPVAAQQSSGASRRQRRARAGPRSGRVQAKRGRAGYGAVTRYKAGGPRRSCREARVRRWPGGSWGSPWGRKGGGEDRLRRRREVLPRRWTQPWGGRGTAGGTPARLHGA